MQFKDNKSLKKARPWVDYQEFDEEFHMRWKPNTPHSIQDKYAEWQKQEANIEEVLAKINKKMRVHYKTTKGKVIDIDYHIDAYEPKEGERWVSTKKENESDPVHHFLINGNGDIIKGFNGLFKNIKDIGKKVATTVKEVVVKTWGEAKAYAEKLGFKVKEETKIIPPTELVNVAQMITRVQETFPRTKDYVQNLGVAKSKTALWAMGDHMFCFGTEVFTKDGGLEYIRNEYNKSNEEWKIVGSDSPITESEKTRFKTQNRTPEGGVAHELGHAMANMLFEEEMKAKYPDYPYLGYYETRDAIKRFNKGGGAINVMQEACRRVKKTAYGKGKKNAELVAHISGYALARQPAETLAECVADWYDNREKANPLSIEVVKVLNERLGGNAIQGL